MLLFGWHQIHAALGALTRLVHLDFGMHRAGPDLRLSTIMGCGVIGNSAMTAVRLQGRGAGYGENQAEERLKDELFHSAKMRRK
jgi:hypothetical protein